MQQQLYLKYRIKTVDDKLIIVLLTVTDCAKTWYRCLNDHSGLIL